MPIEYKVTQEGVTPSNGAVAWSKQGDVVTIKLKGNLLGMITIDEGGSYIFDATEYTIFPGKEGDTNRQKNAIDGNFMLNDNIELTIKGNGKYYSGTHHVIYLAGSGTKNLYIESGIFYDDDIWGSEIYIDKVGNENVYLFKAGASNVEEYTTRTTIDTSNLWGWGAFMVKQGTISDDGKSEVQNIPDPESLEYFINPEQQDSNPSNPDNSDQEDQNPGGSPSNPNEGVTIPSNVGDGEDEGYTGSGEEKIPVVIVIPEGQKYVENVLEQLSAIPTDGKVVIDTKDWYCFNKTLAEKIADRKDVSVTINYKYQGKKYEVTIPAGSDVVSLLDENGFVGFRYLDAVFGGKEITE